MGEAIVGRCITTQVVGNVQVVAPVVVVVDIVVVWFRVVGLWVVVGVGMVVGAVVDWFRMVDGQRGWWPIVDYMANRRKNMGLVVPVTSEAMTCCAKADWPRGSWTKTFWA